MREVAPGLVCLPIVPPRILPLPGLLGCWAPRGLGDLGTAAHAFDQGVLAAWNFNQHLARTIFEDLTEARACAGASAAFS